MTCLKLWKCWPLQILSFNHIVTMASKLLKVIAVGDVMLGRLVDQLFECHNPDPTLATAKYFLKSLNKPVSSLLFWFKYNFLYEWIWAKIFSNSFDFLNSQILISVCYTWLCVGRSFDDISTSGSSVRKRELLFLQSACPFFIWHNFFCWILQPH